MRAYRTHSACRFHAGYGLLTPFLKILKIKSHRRFEMSRDIGLSIDLSMNNKKISRYEILKYLWEDGWRFLDNGQFTYLLLGNDDWDWNSASMSEQEIFDFLKIKSNSDEVIGFVMTWSDTNIGGDVLFFPNFEFLFSININIKEIYNKIVDINWYLIKLLPVFDKNGVLYNSIVYNEYR